MNRRQFLQVVALFGAGALAPAAIAGSLAANQTPVGPIRRPATRTPDPAESPAPPRIGIVAVGSHEELLAQNALYQRLYSLQFNTDAPAEECAYA